MTLYRAVWLVVAQGTRALWRVRVEGAERLPETGGYVLAPSHRSMVDIPLLSVITTRRIRFMGKVEAFKIPVLSSIFRALGGFPVARDGTDRKALRDAMAMLQAGDILAVFPEGTRQRGPKIAAAPARSRVSRVAGRCAGRPRRNRGQRGDTARAQAADPALRARRDRDR